MKTYEPLGGTEISEACEEATELARQTRETVRFNFNDIEVRAVSGTPAKTLTKRWLQECDRRMVAYRNSDEFRVKEEEWRLKLAGFQVTVDGAMSTLPTALDWSEAAGKSDILIEWFANFGAAAGWSGVIYDKSTLVSALERAGYVDGFGVGEPKAFFEVRENKARYIVGQFITCIKKAGCWPDILVYWCEQFKEVKS